MYSTLLCLALLPLVSSLFLANQKCCPDGECYDLGSPWQSLTRPAPAPRCIEDPVNYLLTNRVNSTNPVVFSSGNFSNVKDYYNASKPTVILFHGYFQSEDPSQARNMTVVYLTKVDANAISVDFAKISKNMNYLQVASDIRVAARYLIKAVKYLITLGTTASQIHLIGFSIGAHLAAYLAKAVPGIGRLTGLDPAGPLFTNQNCEVRLCKGDAEFTEAIHTNGDALFGLGTSDECADVDFWVNGGWDQPKCGIALNLLFFLQNKEVTNIESALQSLLCSHARAALIYTEALASKCTLWGVKADIYKLNISRLALGYPTKSIVSTEGCTLANCVPIGLETINATGRGNFIVPTNSEPPFCV